VRFTLTAFRRGRTQAPIDRGKRRRKKRKKGREERDASTSSLFPAAISWNAASKKEKGKKGKERRKRGWMR